MIQGVWYAVGAYVIWGLLPIYLHWLRQVPAFQIVSHRIVWSCALLFAVIFAAHSWRAFRAAAFVPRTIGIYVIAAVLIAINWLVYVWGANAGFIVELSLGYYINPLISVLLGVVFLGERLRVWQWVPIGLAAAGVFYLSFAHGAVPWIALALAFSFGTYGLVKKIAPLGALFGLALETAVLLLPALAYLAYAEGRGDGAFLHTDISMRLLLIGAGAITAIPLLLFASATRRIPLWLNGMLQYIAPTLQFLLGVLVYREPFTHAQAIGFGLVWLALTIFAAESFLARGARTTAT